MMNDARRGWNLPEDFQSRPYVVKHDYGSRDYWDGSHLDADEVRQMSRCNTHQHAEQSVVDRCPRCKSKEWFVFLFEKEEAE